MHTSNLMKAKCLISDIHDPYFNLATEDFIFNNLNSDEHILFLWRNDKSVIIGRNQNPWAECNLKKIEQEGVNLVRRQSGGGAVYQDLGNTIFTFLSPRSEYDRKRNFDIIIKALAKFGIKAEQSGRNDILVNGKKISGSAFKENPSKAFHHGTLLINVDLSKLNDLLTPHPKKLEAKGTSSVKARVANLAEFNPSINHNLLTNAIIEEFFNTYKSEKKIEILDHNHLKQIPELNKYYNSIKDNKWVLGETPNFKHQLTEKFDWAFIDLHINTDAGKISKTKMFTDCLDTQLVEEIEKCLNNTEYHPEKICTGLDCIKEKLPHTNQQISDFQNWIRKELV